MVASSCRALIGSRVAHPAQGPSRTEPESIRRSGRTADGGVRLHRPSAGPLATSRPRRPRSPRTASQPTIASAGIEQHVADAQSRSARHDRSRRGPIPRGRGSSRGRGSGPRLARCHRGPRATDRPWSVRGRTACGPHRPRPRPLPRSATSRETRRPVPSWSSMVPPIGWASGLIRPGSARRPRSTRPDPRPATAGRASRRSEMTAKVVSVPANRPCTWALRSDEGDGLDRRREGDLGRRRAASRGEPAGRLGPDAPGTPASRRRALRGAFARVRTAATLTPPGFDRALRGSSCRR